MERIQHVTSAANPLVKDIRLAIARGGLTDEGWCVAESFHLLREALRSQRNVPVIIASEAVASDVERELPVLEAQRVVAVPERLFQAISSTETSQGVIALVEPPVWRIEDLFNGRSLVIVLDGIQDPGNAGAIVRAAEAFGASGVIFLRGSANPFHPKTLRASAGSLFRLPFAAGLDPVSVRDRLDGRHLNVYAAMPFTGDERVPEQLDFGSDCVIVIGGEGGGVSREMLAIAEKIAIPTAGVESLNASVAAGVLLYEARRQRLKEAARD